jgi:hypothetical protein
MKTPALLLCLAVTLFSDCPSAEESRLADDHIFKPLLGKRVVAEGLGWGAASKGLGERVVLPSGVSIYFTGRRYSKLHRNGRLVRVVGTISVKRMAAAPPGAQGYTDGFDYYALEVESIEVIEEVTHEFPQLVKK